MPESERIELRVGDVHGLDHHLNGATGLAALGRREYSVRFIRAGRVRAQGNRLSNVEIPAEPIRRAIEAGMFDGRASFLDHAGWFDYPSLRDLVGVTLESSWNEGDQSADGVIRLYEGAAADAVGCLLDGMLNDQASGGPVPDVGLSLVFWPKWKPRDNHDDPLVLESIRHIESCDFVFEPGADGRVKQALASNEYIASLRAGLLDSEQSELQDCSNADASILSLVSGGIEMADEVVNNPSNESIAHSEPANTPDAAQAAAWVSALESAGAAALIAGSGLPAASRERLAQQHFASPEAVQAAIEAERTYLARLQQDHVVQLGGTAPRSPQITLGRTGLEQVQMALEALIAGRRPADGVQPLTGIRELYHLLSGDYEMSGVFQPERITLANVNCSTMAGMVANALNKVIANTFIQYPRWWEPITVMQDFDNLQQVKWITLGGVGELPTVAEGAAYTELTWDDKTETADFVKKGGYLGLTIEAIDKDDTRRLRAAPQALAQAAWLTLSKAVSYIFTQSSGVGPTMSDSTALFDASGHGNLGTTALSVTTYNAARLAMRKQTELNSGERLGALTAPKFLLVPPDLEITALQILASEKDYTYTLSNGQDAPANVNAEGSTFEARMNAARERVIVVDLWTDTNDWAAVADPRLYPSLGIGFRYGRTPEIFSVASPTAGLMFTNDTMPVKVRFFFAVGPIDWKGLYKANVA